MYCFITVDFAEAVECWMLVVGLLVVWIGNDWDDVNEWLNNGWRMIE